MVGYNTLLEPVGPALVCPRTTANLGGAITVLSICTYSRQQHIQARGHLSTSLSLRIRPFALL